MYGKTANFNELEGKLIKNIDGGVMDDELIFECENGDKYKMYHMQDCCEDVRIEEIIGDLKNIEGRKVLSASEVTQEGESDWGHSTWTFYEISTVRGTVTIRWYGESNGYYSETVDFEKINTDE